MERLGRACDQIPTLHAYFSEAGQLYLVQDWIDGQSLMQMVKERGVFSDGRVRSLLSDLLPVLDYVHSQGIIHRDIKPENVMLRAADDKPVLIDFGAVKEIITSAACTQGASNSSIAIGSPGFMPLEQAAGKPVYSSDLYSLGLTAICLLTGRRPRELADPVTGDILWRKHVAEVSPDLAALLDKASHPYAENRYRTAQEMLEALRVVDSNSDLTIVKRHARPDGFQPRSATSTPKLHCMTADPLLPHGGRKGSSFRFLQTTILLAVGLLAVMAAFIYPKRGDTLSLSGKVSERASYIRPTNQVVSDQEPASTHQVMGQTGDFEILNTSDGFTSVRAAPTTKSAEMRRLYPRTMISCEDVVEGERLWGKKDWRYCPAVGGYIHSKLLKKY